MDEPKDKIDSIYEAVQELTKQTAEIAKELQKFKETYEKYQKAGKFILIGVLCLNALVAVV